MFQRFGDAGNSHRRLPTCSAEKGLLACVWSGDRDEPDMHSPTRESNGKHPCGLVACTWMQKFGLFSDHSMLGRVPSVAYPAQDVLVWQSSSTLQFFRQLYLLTPFSLCRTSSCTSWLHPGWLLLMHSPHLHEKCRWTCRRTVAWQNFSCAVHAWSASIVMDPGCTRGRARASCTRRHLQLVDSRSIVSVGGTHDSST